MKYLFILIFLFAPIFVVKAADTMIDSDNDGLSDQEETNVYHSDANNSDTDNDGFDDGVEIKNSYSPLDPKPTKLKDSDYDHDSLSDDLEIKFHADLTNSDTDGDGFTDGDEIKNGYDPLSVEKKKLAKKIEINIKNQKLSYFLSDVELGEFPVSSGKNNSTPKGTYKVLNKSLKAWSKFGLWMPYWLGLGSHGEFGIHELPYWPNGYREGSNHLGTPVSHGCVRLGIGPAKLIYDWVEVGTPVVIK
ncbi:MAG: L,D-transpeptidase family protein [Patescibacteria group bacterium]|nr:L,D-transpeptidase family protein [Patescibacteria group bacterium]MDD4610370.1 L,D-transpeptidase family protein [Patescibacteria group bacterium]